MKRKAKLIHPDKLRGFEQSPANSKAGQKRFGYEVPPDEELVQIYFDQQDLIFDFRQVFRLALRRSGLS
jgi:hypothetical protein